MSKKSVTFASDNDEEPTALANSQYADNDYDDDPVGALAYTDFTKPVPVLEGKDAERFIRMMEENERKAAERAKRPMTVEEAKKELSYEKMFLKMKENEVKEMKDRIKKLEEYIKNN
jgi:DNA repair exonuclease SbcCD ATPase subunit